MINVRSSFIDSEITFKWNVSTNEPSPTFYITYNNSWTKVNDTKHTVKDVYLFRSISIDVTYHGGYDRWNYTGNATFFAFIQVCIAQKLNEKKENMHASKKLQCSTYYNYTEHPYITRVLNFAISLFCIKCQEYKIANVKLFSLFLIFLNS